MRSLFVTPPILLGVLSFQSCKPKIAETGEISASQRGNGGQNLRCETILSSVENVATKTLGTMVAYARSGGKHPVALEVSRGTVIMLENMMRSPTNPIHPAAFYAAVKDFETSSNLGWATKNASGLQFYTTKNCTSYQCFGLFQVDVKIEPKWGGGAFCQGPGLNLWSTTAGGADFCAAQFWWIAAEGGRKCESLSGSRRNPCKERGYTWTTAEVARGRAAYVQAIQPGWNANAWGEMYENYERCYTENRRTPLLQAVAAFRRAIGLGDSRSFEYGISSDDNNISVPVSDSGDGQEVIYR